MIKKYPLTIRAFYFLILPILAILVLIYKSLFLDALPINSGEVFVKGLREPAQISRDPEGVVYIEAKNDRDVYFSMGYAHAQDRLWQLEFQRRLSQGRLSEIFGESTIDQDIWIRTLGIYRSAIETIQHLEPESVESLEAYANGVNAWINTATELPIEFSILDISPEPWKVEDSLAWIKMFALNLASNSGREIQHYIASQYLSRNQLKAFFPYGFDIPLYISNQQVSQKSALIKIEKQQQLLKREYGIGNKYSGSNAWVISGKHTKSGFPIMASDPHLGVQIPSLWYPVSQKGTQIDVTGMSLVGLPIVVFGRNKKIAWSGTNMMADVQDIYFEEMSKTKQNKYMSQGRWVDFSSRVERIKVKSDFPSILRKELKPLDIKLRSTHNGPVVSDIFTGTDDLIVLKWTALQELDKSYDAFYKLTYADDWNSFKAALKLHVAPAMNMLYADIKNNIGMIGAGKIPIREGYSGNYPVPQGTGTFRWTGFIPFEDMPQTYNPDKGYLINANNKNSSSDYPFVISHEFAPNARAQRIEYLIKEKINSGQKFEHHDMKTIQADEVDMTAFKLLKVLKKHQGESSVNKNAIEFIRQWNGKAERESIGATIYYSWIMFLNEEIFADELTGYWNKKIHKEHLERLYETVSPDYTFSLLRNDSEWCDNVNSTRIESCKEILEASLSKTIDELTKLLGDDMEEWQWGNAQYTQYTHSLFGKLKIFNTLFNRKISNGGAVNSINVSSSVYIKSKGFVQDFGAGFRQIIEFRKDSFLHFFMNSTGQSGQLMSPNYDNMVQRFRDVEFVKFEENDMPFAKKTLLTPKESKN
jgi:penicillin amidase